MVTCFETATVDYSSDEHKFNSRLQEARSLCPELWKRLPDDLLDLVFRKLPARYLLPLRALNKTWMSRILTSEFLPWIMDQANCVLLLYVDQCLIIYNVKSNSWHEQSLQKIFESSPNVFVDPCINLSRLELIASDSGFLCFSTKDYEQFIICNPITRQLRYLVLPDETSTEATSAATIEFQSPADEIVTSSHNGGRRNAQLLGGLHVDADTGDYKLLIATLYKGSPLRTSIYNSQSRSWKQVKQVQSTLDPDNSRRLSIDLNSRLCQTKRGCVVCNGSLYSLVQYMDVFWELFKFDLESELWSIIPLRRNVLFNIQLTEHEGKLMLVETPWWNRYNFYVLTECDDKTIYWSPILEGLTQQLETLCRLLHKEFRVACCLSCISPGLHTIYFISHDHKGKLLSNTTSVANDLRLLVYNVHTNLLQCVQVGKHVIDRRLSESKACAFRPSGSLLKT